MMKIIFLGPPGAGKGTSAGEIKDKYAFTHLSTGDILRAQMKEGTELGKMAKNYIDNGQLVPDDVIIGMVQDKLSSLGEGTNILFDGFPRTVQQAEALDQIAKIDKVINLDVDVEVIVRRISSRRTCKNCGKVYSVSWLKGDTCEACGGELYIRDDDTEETTRNRFQVYMEQTLPLVEYYRKAGILVTINADDAVENIVKKVAAELEGI